MTWSAQPAFHLCVDETDIRWLVQSGELVLISLYDSQWKGTGPLFISKCHFFKFYSGIWYPEVQVLNQKCMQLRGVKSDIDLSECKWSRFSLQKKLSGARAIALNFRVTKQSCIQCSCSNAYSIQNTPWMHIKIIVKMWCIEHVNIKSMCFL